MKLASGSLTPTEKIQQLMLWKALGQRFDTKEDIEREWSEFRESDYYSEVEWEVRGGDYQTDIPAPYSRHYESLSVAAKMLDGSYVGWVYWYGGGKHGEPAEIEWMEDAYELESWEETVVVRKFKKKETSDAVRKDD